ncbi:MAG: hypothetical protein MUC46_08875 [Desulfobacterales bacterium]|nr:hypothetical protein [Desulfobacterales bacterium]
MQIKRFEAKTMTLALQMVKAEFGPDAVILSARSLRSSRGIFGPLRPAGVEVTAARDGTGGIDLGRLERPVAPVPDAAPASKGSGGGLLRSLNQGFKQLAFRRRPETGGPLQAGAASAPTAGRHAHLLAQEVEGELAGQIIAHLAQRPGEDPCEELLLRLESQGLRRRPESDSPRAIALLGGTGVGKTTVAIKLAAGLIGRGRPAALLTLDDRRIGAMAQLQVYADILGIPLAFAGSPAEAGDALNRHGSEGTLIVDTPGVSPGEEGRCAEIERILSAVPGVERYLTLGLNGRERDLERIAARWRTTALSGFVLTRLDETDVWGPAINLSVRTRLPIAWVSCGPRIPEDFSADPLPMILERLLPPAEAAPKFAPRTPAGFGPGTGRLVANRNSDLYHRPECRWARKIKSDNLIRFDAPAEAAAQHFLPCRSCSPEKAQTDALAPVVGASDRRRAALQ